jgi:hypothetical protein
MGKQRKGARGLLAGLLCSALAAQGCAAGAGLAGGRVQTPRDVAAGQTILAEYVQKLPPGAAIRVERANGATLRGTLLKATGQSLFVQPRTRVPEPAVEVAISEVLRVEPYSPAGPNVAKAIAIGAAAGAGAALAVFFIIAYVYAD